MTVTRLLTRAAALLGALLVIGLLTVSAANAATAVKASGAPTTPRAAATTQRAASAQRAETTAKTVTSGGVCSVPGIGDIGSLLGLCQAGSSGIVGDLNNICNPGTETPEQADAGLNSMIEPPSSVTAGGKTLYDNYGVSGQFWAAYGLQCSDMTSLIGNNVAGMVFDMAKSLDRVTITVYQSAAGNGILAWLQGAVDKLISALGKAVYFPYLSVVVILGAIWLAWQGLIRKRATRTIEGTLWMIVAAAAAIWLIGKPADFTGVGTNVSNGVTQVLNVAFANLPATNGGNCLPVAKGDPQSVTSNYAFTSSNGLVDENANELWSVMVCEPWLYGEFGTTAYSPTPTGPQSVVNQYGRQLLWSQAVAANEQPTSAVLAAKQATYVGIANALSANYPATYTLFQGKQWTTRLEIGFAALFAAVAAGLLILLIALTLIVLKLGFLLLLVLGPFFLIIGTHPGFGRVVAIRWFEMLAGVLMKQVAIALALSVLLYCYALIMGTSAAALPWALKILMIALVTVAVFIYRKPFQHLFSAVGYGMIGSNERAEFSFREASQGFRRNSTTAATVGVPGFAAYRVARWARRNPAAAAGVAAAGTGVVAAGVAAGAATEGATTEGTAGGGTAMDAAAARLRPDQLPNDPNDASESSGEGDGVRATSRRGRNWPLAGSSGGSRSAPPLPLSREESQTGPGTSRPGWSRGSSADTGTTGRAATPPARQASRQEPPASAAAAAPPPPASPRPRRSGGSSWPGGSGWFGGAPGSGSGAESGPAAGSSGIGLPGAGTRSGGPSGGTGSGARSSGGSGSGGHPWSPTPARTRTGSRPAGSSGSGSSAGGGAGEGEQANTKLPFWLRPVRRDK
jgi:TrbL/VirB6 plasmid conjugal transfer protein